MVCPSGERSSDSHVASDVVKASDRSVRSGSPLFFTASAAALSFCARVCASGAYDEIETMASRHSRRTASLGMGPLSSGEADYMAGAAPARGGFGARLWVVSFEQTWTGGGRGSMRVMMLAIAAVCGYQALPAQSSVVIRRHQVGPVAIGASAQSIYAAFRGR